MRPIHNKLERKNHKSQTIHIYAKRDVLKREFKNSQISKTLTPPRDITTAIQHCIPSLKRVFILNKRTISGEIVIYITL